MSKDFMEGVDFNIKLKGMIQRAFKEEMLSFEYLDEVMVSNFLALQNKLIEEIKKEYRFDSLNCKVKDVRAFLIGEE